MRMVKQHKKTDKKRRVSVSGFMRRHRAVSILLIISVLVLAFVGVIKYVSYLNKFSGEDFVATAAAAERIFERVGANDVEKYESCRYRAPEKYSSVRLYCSVQMAAYLPYKSEENALSVAKKLEQEVSKLGQTSSYLSRFYEKPQNTLTDVTVSSDIFRDKQCLFTIASNEKAKSAATLLPDKNEDDLIAMVFNCSAESREEYFPVTYRQG
jgi:hypothetical protein